MGACLSSWKVLAWEIWGDMGRYGEVWGGMGRCSQPEELEGEGWGEGCGEGWG